MSSQSHTGASSSISFHINGSLYTVKDSQYEFSMSLSDYIREVAGFKGTKVMCREAGCGAGAVTVTVFDTGLQKDRTFSINSCLCPLYSVAGWQIVTVEGIGNQRDGFHPIQERVAAFKGSQCGYCTPGMVMNMYGFLHVKPKPTMEEVEGAFDRNICRCTGYRVDELYKREVTDYVTLGSNHSLSSLETSYFGALQQHILKIGNLPLRNAGSWAGNLKIKQAHNDFNSDLFVMMDAAGTHVEIFDTLTETRQSYPLVDVMKMSMAGKVVLSLKLFKEDREDHFRSFKIMPRSQNAHAYVNAGFRFKLDSVSKHVLGKPSIVIGGISATFNHALKTEDFLTGKSLADPGVVRHIFTECPKEGKNKSQPYQYWHMTGMTAELTGCLVEGGISCGIAPFPIPIVFLRDLL